jgi:hypothetical protein
MDIPGFVDAMLRPAPGAAPSAPVRTLERQLEIQ